MRSAQLKQYWIHSIIVSLFITNISVKAMDTEAMPEKKDIPAENTESNNPFETFEKIAKGKGNIHVHLYMGNSGKQARPQTDEEVVAEARRAVLQNTALERGLADEFSESFAKMQGKKQAYATVEAQKVLAENFDENAAKVAGRKEALAALEAQRILAENFDEDEARIAGRTQAYATLEAQKILSERPLAEILRSGVNKGIEQGVTQATAELIVLAATLGIQKGVQYYYQPSAEQLKEIAKQKQQEEIMAELNKNTTQYHQQAQRNSVMITALVDSAVKLNDEEAKKLALAALKKYAEQTNLVLDMQKETLVNTMIIARDLMNS